MARHNVKNSHLKGTGAVSTVDEAVVNHNGEIGVKRDVFSELFLLAVSSFNEDSFYESADSRSDRLINLVGQVSQNDDWILGLVTWLRKNAGLRAVPTSIAAEAVKSRLDKGIFGGNREIVRASIGRLDEVPEFLAYWMSRFGRKIPSSVKRGLSDALNDYMTEGGFLKWRGRSSRGAVSLRDAINLIHAKPKDDHQAALYAAVLDSAYGNDVRTEKLPVVKARDEVLCLSKEKLVSVLSSKKTADDTIRSARLTHEVIAGVLGKIPGKIWDNLVPSMGYTALRMNLRRIGEAGVSKDTIALINERLSDPEQVASSRVMPIELLSAFRNAPAVFADALHEAANLSLSNVPELSGRTLILVDNSYSMSDPLSARSSLSNSDAANVFGAALAMRAKNADLVSFSNDTIVNKFDASGKLLEVADNLPGPDSGTMTHYALQKHYNRHDRVIIITDEQYGYGWGSYRGDLGDLIPKNIPLFTWNLNGYRAAHVDSGPGRFAFGGLTDKGFQLIPLIEKGLDTGFPWENKEGN